MRKHRHFTEQQRSRILSVAAREGLTRMQAAETFGVSEVTLWKWRRDAKGVKTKHQARADHTRRASADGSLASMIRAEVQARVRELVPSIIREEIAQGFGSKRRARLTR